MNQYIFYMTTVALANNSVSKESLPQLNILEIILNSSPIVMGVLLLLMGFSLVSWAIIFHKWRVLGQAESSTENFLEVFWSGKSMDHIYSESKKYPNTPLATIFQAGYKELQRLMDRERQKTSSKEHTTTDLGSLVPPESSIENLERSLNVAARREALKLESSMTFLATAASTAPFYWPFWNGLGNHELLPKYWSPRRSEFSHSSTRHSRGTCCHCCGFGLCHSRYHGIQLFQ